MIDSPIPEIPNPIITHISIISQGDSITVNISTNGTKYKATIKMDFITILAFPYREILFSLK
jgi:hypothetical protein